MNNVVNMFGTHKMGKKLQLSSVYVDENQELSLVLGFGSKPNIEIGPRIINFTVGITEYQAEEGMTFADWISSSYNVNNYSITSNNYMENNTYRIDESPTTVIRENVIYMQTPLSAFATIEFNISSSAYSAERGMTWAQWINSSYNPLAIISIEQSTNYVIWATDYNITLERNNVFGSDIIRPLAKYQPINWKEQ